MPANQKNHHEQWRSCGDLSPFDHSCDEIIKLLKGLTGNVNFVIKKKILKLWEEGDFTVSAATRMIKIVYIPEC